ncbi:MAG: adenine nucleotide alpha hydrolase family protein [Candidatus Freyarchaeota archaeon]|nr:adenine nucleotide alpha hydrolase family protein [Candidatus Jordarchaeia archaeon]
MLAGRCRWCDGDAEVFLPYARLSLCRTHFKEYIVRRVRRTIEKYRMIKEGERVLVALSGGKDSLVLLHVLLAMKNSNDPKLSLNCDLEAVTLDLGIRGYSEKCVSVACAYCDEFNVPHYTVKLIELAGFTIDDMASQRRPACSVCGVVKRYVLNKVGVEMGFDRLAMGHNLDDEAAVLLSNYLSANVELLSRQHPVLPAREGMVSRIKPLFEVSESETSMYAQFQGLTPVDGKCPYAVTPSTHRFKRALNALEEEAPATKIKMVRGFIERVKPLLDNIETPPGKCAVCGYPSSSGICGFCRLKKAYGPM